MNLPHTNPKKDKKNKRNPQASCECEFCRIFRLKSLLDDWVEFAKDVQPGCMAGFEVLEGLKARTIKELTR